MTQLEMFYIAVRIAVITLGFIAMWSLWQAREKRGYSWTKKMKEIWLSLFLFVFLSIQANLELLYREVRPTVALYFIVLVLMNVIRHSMSTEGYTKDQPPYE